MKPPLRETSAGNMWGLSPLFPRRLPAVLAASAIIIIVMISSILFMYVCVCVILLLWNFRVLFPFCIRTWLLD